MEIKILLGRAFFSTLTLGSENVADLPQFTVNFSDNDEVDDYDASDDDDDCTSTVYGTADVERTQLSRFS